MMNGNWTRTFRVRKFVNPCVLAFLGIFLGLSACSENDEILSNNLSSILASYNESQLDEVIACAASDQNNSVTSHNLLLSDSSSF